MKPDELKQVVQAEVQAILDESGSVTASELVNRATPKDSPAHEAFEWDNKKAGGEYRLIQARKWLRVVVVRTERADDEQLVHIPVSKSSDSAEGEYKPISVVAQSPDDFERALDEASARLLSAQKSVDRLRVIAESSGVPDRVAMVAQISRGLDIMRSAIQSVH
jgi:flavin-binding protein dodecin